jgi:hypothetical protein
MLLENASRAALMSAMVVGTGVIVPIMLGAQGSFFAQQFPAETRSTGLGTSRELGTAVSGGLAPLGALSLVAASPTNSTFGVGVVLVIAAVLVAVPALVRRTEPVHRERDGAPVEAVAPSIA